MAPRFENPTWQVWYLWTDWIIGRLPGLENLRNHQPGVKSRPFCDIVSWGFNRTPPARWPLKWGQKTAQPTTSNNHNLPPTTKGSISTIYIHLSILKIFLALGGWLNDHDLYILRANVSHHIRGDLYKTGDRLCVTVTSQIRHFALHGWGCQGCVTESKGVSDFSGFPRFSHTDFRYLQVTKKNRECHGFPWEYPPKCHVFFPLQFDLCRTVDVIFSRYGGIPNLIQLLIACYHVLIVWYIHIMRYNCTYIYIHTYIRMWILYPDR